MRSPLTRSLLILASLLFALQSCRGRSATIEMVSITVSADGQRHEMALPSGSTVLQALQAAGITLGQLDRIEPPSYAVVSEGMLIHVSRITERFEIESSVLPFEQQTLRSETLPSGETQLIQGGQNGLVETTYRIIEEEGIEISRAPVKHTIIREPVPEILLIGTQSVYTPLPIAGTLAYAASGNAWILRGDSGSRRPVYVGGDMDGQVFALSPDGDWLLFTRQEQDIEVFNSLWVVSTIEPDATPIDLGARNIIHFADWLPSASTPTIAYTTAEPRPAAPGWQANNDLVLLSFSTEEMDFVSQIIIPTNAGGEYGWWGTEFRWAPDGSRLAYARPDGVGIVNLDTPAFTPWLSITPYQSLSDWAWVPGIDWSDDGGTLFVVEHGPPIGIEEPQASPAFNLSAVIEEGSLSLPLVERVGMFAYPSCSPCIEGRGSGQNCLLAFLQALSPLESDRSRYQLVVMDRDGSNRRSLFPAEGEQGLEPQRVVWSPDAARIALIYRGDLWIVDISAGVGQRLTGDGQTTGISWAP
jgi:hypothetical protein